MTTLQFKRPNVTWRRLLLGSLGAGAVAGAIWIGRLATTPEAGAAPAPPAAESAAPPAAPPAAPVDATDYGQRAVAYVYGGTRVSREQLGEYLIARFGPDKVLNLVNKLIIERTCQERGITVTDAEVDLALADDVADLKINRREFVDKLLREYHKSLYEWKEDVLRPKLLVTKLLRDTLPIKDEDVRRAFDSAYGERVYCQAIMWPLAREEELRKQYDTLVKDDAEFTRVARTNNSKALQTVGGILEPVSHHSLDDEEVEKLLFTLKEGEITPLVRVRMGKDTFCAIIKVLKKLPPDPTKKLEDVRPALEKEILDVQVREAMPQQMAAMQKAADPKIVLKPILDEDNWDRGLPRGDAPAANGVPPAQQPVAYVYGSIAVTREQLGEYLIARYGNERVELMVNKMIVEKECAERGIAVTEAEIEAALAKDIKISKAADREDFIKNYLRANRTTLYGYREDVLRPKLLLAKVARGSVKVEPEDLARALEAYHGERAECQIIMWPHTQRDHEIAIKQYDLIRRGPAQFDSAAKTQASLRLAATAGRIDPFGRHTTGDEDFEREVFALREGEITPVVETREGYVVARLIRKVPASKPPEEPAAAAAERARWEAEIIEKKTQLQIPAEFAKLRDTAAPKLLLQPTIREEDWIREVKQEITGTPATPRTARN